MKLDFCMQVEKNISFEQICQLSYALTWKFNHIVYHLTSAMVLAANNDYARCLVGSESG